MVDQGRAVQRLLVVIVIAALVFTLNAGQSLGLRRERPLTGDRLIQYTQVIVEGLPATLELVLTALLFIFLGGEALRRLTAARQWDGLVRGLGLLGAVVIPGWLAIMWLAVQGSLRIAGVLDRPLFGRCEGFRGCPPIYLRLEYLIAPGLCLALAYAFIYLCFIRPSTETTLPARLAWLRHGTQPTPTFWMPALIGLAGATVAIERLFNWEGVGQRAFLMAFQSFDFGILAVFVVVVCIITQVVGLLIDARRRQDQPAALFRFARPQSQKPDALVQLRGVSGWTMEYTPAAASTREALLRLRGETRPAAVVPARRQPESRTAQRGSGFAVVALLIVLVLVLFSVGTQTSRFNRVIEPGMILQSAVTSLTIAGAASLVAVIAGYVVAVYLPGHLREFLLLLVNAVPTPILFACVYWLSPLRNTFEGYALLLGLLSWTATALLLREGRQTRTIMAAFLVTVGNVMVVEATLSVLGLLPIDMRTPMMLAAQVFGLYAMRAGEMLPAMALLGLIVMAMAAACYALAGQLLKAQK